MVLRETFFSLHFHRLGNFMSGMSSCGMSLWIARGSRRHRLNGVFDAEEACRYLKIGLLCTQDSPKLRPTMSTVVKLLKGEKDIDTRKIIRPV
ncbi:hypothetical protein Bca52824_011168 [Brassica carinata]|uniref:Uncharacterized protein n=1 Tax=Brassica carinata TaxID=52824 RepID=A0A8X7WGN4_BRACI|nr:hypothetical protein Bca52824_011168 [Brassica carinata]